MYVVGLALGIDCLHPSPGAGVGGYYSNRTVLSGFVEYSNDSSHMLIGYADGRKISAVGASFERRAFLSNDLSGSWLAEVRPLMSVSDPTLTGFALQFPQEPAYSGIVKFSSPIPVVQPVTSAPLDVILVTSNQVYAGTATYIGGMRSTYASGLSPLGYRLSVLPRKPDSNRSLPVWRLRGSSQRSTGVQQRSLQLHLRARRGGRGVSHTHTLVPAGISLPSPLQRWKGR